MPSNLSVLVRPRKVYLWKITRYFFSGNQTKRPRGSIAVWTDYQSVRCIILPNFNFYHICWFNFPFYKSHHSWWSNTPMSRRFWVHRCPDRVCTSHKPGLILTAAWCVMMNDIAELWPPCEFRAMSGFNWILDKTRQQVAVSFASPMVLDDSVLKNTTWMNFISFSNATCKRITRGLYRALSSHVRDSEETSTFVAVIVQDDFNKSQAGRCWEADLQKKWPVPTGRPPMLSR